MMRQYELVERVRKYNPHIDEDLLNRAYVYAMQAHGAQKRASGDPYFSHPLEVAAILTDLKLDDATIVAARSARHDRGHRAPPAQEIDELFGDEIGKLVDGLTKLEKLDLVSKQAAQAREFPQTAAGDRRRRARAAGQARRPPAQHAHAAFRPAGKARPHRPGNARHLCAARRPHGHAEPARGAGGSCLSPFSMPEAFA